MAPSRRSARRPAHNTSASNSKSSHSPQADDADSPAPPARKNGGTKQQRVKEEPADDLDEPPPGRKRGKAKREEKEKSPVDDPEPQADEDEDESGVTRCPCGRADEESGFMIMCDNCKVWQHGSCMGVSEDKPPDEYFCEECRPDLHTDIPAKRKRVRAANHIPSAVLMPPPPPRPRSNSHSPPPKPKSPKRRNTMNSRVTAYEEQISRLLAETGGEEFTATQPDPNRRKRKRSSAGNEDLPSPTIAKRPRSASTASDMPIAAALNDAATPAPTTNGAAPVTNNKAAKNGAQAKEPPPPPPPAAPPATTAARAKKRGGGPKKDKEKEQSVDVNGESNGPSGKRHANQYTYRKEQQERRRAEREGGTGGARRKGDARGQKGDRDADQPALASWALPDYLQHLAHILPTEPPAPPDGEDGGAVKVKWPGKRMTIGDMNKRVRNIVEFVAREQATSEVRRRRVDALAAARLENRKNGVTATRRTNGNDDPPVAPEDAMAVDESAAPTIWDIPIGAMERSPTTEQLMSDLMNDLIAFQEKFGMSKNSASGRVAAARREAAVIASDRNGAAAAAAAA